MGTWPCGLRRIQFYFNRSAPKLERLISTEISKVLVLTSMLRPNETWEGPTTDSKWGVETAGPRVEDTAYQQEVSNCCIAYCLYSPCMMFLCEAFSSYILRSEKSDPKFPFKWVKRKSDGNFKRLLLLRPSEIVHVAAVPAHCEKMASRPLQQEGGMIHVSQDTLQWSCCVMKSILTNMPTEIRSRFRINPISSVPRALRMFKSLTAWSFSNEAQLGRKDSRMISMSWQKRRSCLHIWTV